MDLVDLTKITKETFEYDPKTVSSLFFHAPDSPGLIYFLKKGDHSFCIKGQSVKSIKNPMNDLSSLKDHSPCLLFFETPSFELANSLQEKITNRRFLINDDLLNFAGPSTHWWIKKYPDGFSIKFNHFALSKEHSLKLGPLGDPRIAGRRFEESMDMIKDSFPLKEWKCNEKEFSVSSFDPCHLNFILLKNIFILGKNPTLLSHYPDTELGREIYHYFQEIATIRRFWIELEDRYLGEISSNILE